MIELTPKHCLVWDLDNLLIECGIYYQIAEDRFVADISNYYSVDPEIVKSVLQHIDKQSCNLPNGFNSDRYPASFRAAASAIAQMSHREIELHVLNTVSEIARDVFKAPYTLYPDAPNALSHYVGNHRMVLFTKGDERIQWYKYWKNGLDRWFQPSDVHVTPYKTPEAYESLQAFLGIPKEYLVMIGDSMRDDITACLGAKWGAAIHVTGNHFNWGWETSQSVATERIEHLKDLPSVLKRANV